MIFKKGKYLNWAKMYRLNYLDNKLILRTQEEFEIRELSRKLDNMNPNTLTKQDEFNISIELVNIREKYERKLKRLDFWYKWRIIIELISACILVAIMVIYYVLESI